MEILLQRKLCWLDPVPRQVMKNSSQINLLSKEGQVTCVPAQFLAASSTFLKAILIMPSSLCESSAKSISLPSTTSFTLKLLAQILCMGETEESGGLEITMRNMRELQDVIVMLGLNVNLCPKYTKETGPFGSDIVKEEVLETEDTNTPREFQVQNNCDKLIKKKSTVAKMSSSRGKYRQSRTMKEFKKKMKESFDELDADCSAKTPQRRVDIQAQKRSSIGKHMQSGLLKEFEVKLVKYANKGTLKKTASKEERSFMCNTCGVKFAKYPSLRRHYRENHGIQDEKPGREVVKPCVNKCPKCDLKFKFRGSLSRHLKRVHINERKQEIDFGKELHHKCGECDKMFSNFHMLQRHRKDQHSKMIVKPGLQGITSVSCQDCGLVLTSMNDMIQHSQEVHKRIIDSTENVKMEVLHKDNSSKRIECNDCDKSFSSKSNLRKHVESYHEGKTYGCGECSVICSYRKSVYRHCAAKGHDKELIYMFVDLP